MRLLPSSFSRNIPPGTHCPAKPRYVCDEVFGFPPRVHLAQPGFLVELLTDEISQPGMHAKLGVEHHDTRKTIGCFSLHELAPEALK